MNKAADSSPWAIEIIYYTDPYCTWCWGSEPILRRLEVVFGEQLRLRYNMGGLVENIDDFYDPTNDISSMEQVAPHWLEASTSHGMPVDITVFNKYSGELRSTYPGGIAYKAAELIDEDLAVKYLRRLREAAAALALPIHRRETQLELAKEIGLDTDAFTAALDDGRAEAAFPADVDEAGSQSAAFPPSSSATRAANRSRSAGISLSMASPGSSTRSTAPRLSAENRRHSRMSCVSMGAWQLKKRRRSTESPANRRPKGWRCW